MRLNRDKIEKTIPLKKYKFKFHYIFIVLLIDIGFNTFYFILFSSIFQMINNLII